MPPKQVLKTSGSTGSAELLYDGKKTYYCGATGSGAPTCVTYSSKSGSPLGEILDVYTGAAGLKAVRSLQTQIGSGLGGYHVTFSSDSFAGEPSTCVTWTHASESAKYCVTKSGVLAYAGGASSGSTGSVELTSFSPTASASQFQLPAGAKVTNVP